MLFTGHALSQLWACFAPGNYRLFLHSGLCVFTPRLLRVAAPALQTVPVLVRRHALSPLWVCFAAGNYGLFQFGPRYSHTEPAQCSSACMADGARVPANGSVASCLYIVWAFVGAFHRACIVAAVGVFCGRKLWSFFFEFGSRCFHFWPAARRGVSHIKRVCMRGCVCAYVCMEHPGQRAVCALQP